MVEPIDELLLLWGLAGETTMAGKGYLVVIFEPDNVFLHLERDLLALEHPLNCLHHLVRNQLVDPFDILELIQVYVDAVMHHMPGSAD